MTSANELIPILIDHSILGVIVCLLGWWIKRQNCEAKREREDLQKRLFDLIEKTNEFDNHTGHQLTELRGEIRRLVDRVEGRRRD